MEHRVGDRRIIRLIQKWLKAGVLEDGVVTVSEKGTGQGSVISPLLANIYLHYVFDLWAERWRRREATGDMIIVRYADDIVVGFEHEADARRFSDAMRERLQEFALTLHPEKTRLIEFGRHAAERPEKRGLGQAGDLQLPGLHLHLRQNAAGQIPALAEVPAGPHAGEAAGDQGGTAAADASADPRTGGVAAGRSSPATSTTTRCRPTFRALRSVPLLRDPMLWLRALRRRSQKDRTTWERMKRLADDWLPKPRILHPWPEQRFAVKHPRWEPYAGNPLGTDLCGGRAVTRVPTAIQ